MLSTAEIIDPFTEVCNKATKRVFSDICKRRFKQTILRAVKTDSELKLPREKYNANLNNSCKVCNKCWYFISCTLGSNKITTTDEASAPKKDFASAESENDSVQIPSTSHTIESKIHLPGVCHKYCAVCKKTIKLVCFSPQARAYVIVLTDSFNLCNMAFRKILDFDQSNSLSDTD